MSALTKVFVVLLVILSLLLAAASVTILNVVPSYSTEIETVSAARDTAVARANQLESAGGAQAQTLQAQRDELSNQLNDAQQAVAQLRTQLAAAEADKAQVQAQLTAAQNTVAIATSALDANQQNVQQLQQQVATLRDEANTSLTQYAQTQSALAETQNEFTYARQELRQVKERNQELLSRSEELERTVVALGGDPAGDLNRVAPPAINAVVIETLRLANEPYASDQRRPRGRRAAGAGVRRVQPGQQSVPRLPDDRRHRGRRGVRQAPRPQHRPDPRRRRRPHQR